jgi:DNA polymerase-3 subunit gamma/tau
MSSEIRHTTLYRAYRPADFTEVVGQEQVVSVLKQAIKSNKVAHAYLFSGGRGTGKTSVARILARELGVTDKDLYEIDAASNTGVDNIRELREGVHTVPFESPYKFYIIDEAHMLSKSAWNAFLKTLEEPPSHALFVLATTEREKVPDTIQSRCEIYTFNQPTRAVLVKHLSEIAQKEGYSLDAEAAELVAVLAEGSYRDGLGVLQKVLSSAEGKNISVAHVERVSGTPAGETVRTLVSAIAKKDTQAALAGIRHAIGNNIDARALTKLLINRLRVVLLMRYAPDMSEEFGQDLSVDDIALAKTLVKDAGINSDTLRALLEAYGQMAYAAVPHLPLELAIIEIGEKKAA